MRKNSKYGFSIIEILVAVSILMVGTTAVMALLENLFKLKLQQQVQLNVYKSMSDLATRLNQINVCNAVMNPLVGHDLTPLALGKYPLTQISGGGIQLTVNTNTAPAKLNPHIRISGMSLEFAGDLPQMGQPSAYIWLNVDFSYSMAKQLGPFDQKRILYQVSLDRAPNKPGVYLAGPNPCLDFVSLRNAIAGKGLCAYLGATEHNGVCDLFYSQAIRQMACRMIVGTKLQSNGVLPGRYCESP